jgi:hypothetical protein
MFKEVNSQRFLHVLVQREGIRYQVVHLRYYLQCLLMLVLLPKIKSGSRLSDEKHIVTSFTQSQRVLKFRPEKEYDFYCEEKGRLLVHFRNKIRIPNLLSGQFQQNLPVDVVERTKLCTLMTRWSRDTVV